tara:strand:+ start:99 stop:983 length:885 start_codon:yes stop_codon:yes gene_type:complete
MGFTDKVSELANYFSNNFDKVKQLPTSLAGSITKAVTSVPKAPMFTGTTVEDPQYPDMIRKINSMVETITEGNAYDKFKPSLRPKSNVYDKLKPSLRPKVKSEDNVLQDLAKDILKPFMRPTKTDKKLKTFELNSIPREVFSQEGRSYSLTDTDIDTMAKTIAAEASGESLKGQVGVGFVILNRTLNEWQGKKTVTEIIKSPYQFSVWNADSKVDPKAITPEDDRYITALKVIEGITSSRYKDPTNGAAYYWNPKTAKRKKWMGPAEELNKLTIGRHTFAGQVDDPFKFVYKSD